MPLSAATLAGPHTLSFLSNPPLLPWFGICAARLAPPPVCRMIHDIYPDVLVRLKGLPEHSLATPGLAVAEPEDLRTADVVMTLGDCMGRHLAGHFDPALTKAGRLEIIHPCGYRKAVPPAKEKTGLPGARLRSAN